MNHSFVAAKWNAKACSVCSYAEPLHSDTVQCESCPNIGPVNVIGKIVMCAECEARHNNTEIAPTIDKTEQLSIEQVLNQVNRIVESNAIVNKDGDSVRTILDEAIQGNIKQYTDFFNAKIVSIGELRDIINLDESIEANQKHYALAAALRARIQYLARVLFQTRNAQIEMAGEVKSIQHYISELIPQLRMRLRQEFAANTPNYTPQVIKSTTPKVRAKAKSASDKLAESYAKAMKIPIEQAQRLLNNKLRDECTCQETPGMCKVHSSLSKTEVKK